MNRALSSMIALLLATTAVAEEPLQGLAEAWAAMLAARKEAANETASEEAWAGGIRHYLAGWERSGRTAKGEDLHHLGLMYLQAGRYADQMRVALAWADEASGGDEAWSLYAMAAGGAVDRGELDDGAIDLACDEIERAVDDIAQPLIAAMMLGILGQLHEARGRLDLAFGAWEEACFACPMYASMHVDQLGRAMLGTTHDLDAIADLQKRARRLFPRIAKAMRADIERYRETVPEAFRKAADGVPVMGTFEMLEKGIGRAEAMPAKLDMLGRPLPRWTVREMFGRTAMPEQLRGKVAILVFWRSTSGACARTWPFVRDLAVRHGPEDLVLLGVTVPDHEAVSQRFDLDADFDDFGTLRYRKIEPDRSELPRDPTDEQRAAHRERERALLRRYIANHGLAWDHVMIAREQPRERFGLSAEPHLIVVDRAGRIRFVMGGVIERRPTARRARLLDAVDALVAQK